MVTVVDLRSQVPNGVVGIDASSVRLSWKIDGAARQDAYEIQAAAHESFDPILAETGPVLGDQQVGAAAPGRALASREVRFFRTRVQSEGRWSNWSESLEVEAGLLDADDWVAQAISIPDDPGVEHQASSPLLRREFAMTDEARKARLYITSLGVHDVAINGVPISDELLAPGWTSYSKRILAATHDVTSLLQSGVNVISAVLGDGWYRGRLGWMPGEDRSHYGNELGLIAQLEIDLTDGSSMCVSTDETWQVSTGAIQSADLYDGVVVDLRASPNGWDRPGFDASHWESARSVPFDRRAIRPRMTPPVRILKRWPAMRIGEVDGESVFDGGQNISGFASVAVQGESGDEVTVRHAEVLEDDGSLHTSSLRSARATDTYTLADPGPTDLEPPFTFHGFRYAGVRTPAEVRSVEFVAISSDLPRRSTFECSHPLLNRFHENVVWSQLDNFVSVPSDCPQRDERLGWTGDAQAFAATSCTLFDVEAFWMNWLEDLAADQDPELGVSTVVPDVVLGGEMRYGRAGWADAATVVPWAVYEAYGDAHVLRTQYESMLLWVNSLARRRREDGLLEPSPQFGDWLDPDAPPSRPWEAKADSQFIANAFFAESARLTADAAELIDAPVDEVALLRDLSREMADLTWTNWRHHIYESQTGCAIGLRLGIVPDEEKASVVSSLAGMVRAADGRISTGFLGTPHVLHALAEGGHFDEAFSMLLREAHPSWLYQVVNDATTVWERWDAIRVDGSIHPGVMDPPPGMDESDEGGHMLSFNHYAYGAVVDWMYRYLAGIAPDIQRPGYRHVLLAPKPVAGVDWVDALIESPYGQIRSRWELDPSEDLVVDLELPAGVTGTFLPPATPVSKVFLNDHQISSEQFVVNPGTHRIRVETALISLQDVSR